MIHYIKPHYKIKFTTKDVYRISVSAEISSLPPKDIPRARKALLTRQAKKDPLFTMAFIHWMAKKGDRQAKNLSMLYKGYCESLNSSNLQALKTVCASLLKSSETDPLSLRIALWISLILDAKPVPDNLLPATRLINALIPSLEATLKSPLPKISIAPQEVSLPEIKSKHNAFPDLIKHNGHYYACFREANSHVGYKDEGIVRILKGAFNEATKVWSWKLSGTLSKKGLDLRDPNFFVDGNHTLHLSIGGSIIGKKDKTKQMIPHMATMNDNGWELHEADSAASRNSPNGEWIWRVTWNKHDNKGYALSYGEGSCVHLVSTHDGLTFKKVASIAFPPLTELNEGTLRFRKDGSAIALIRTRRNGIIAHSSPSSGYTDWTCHRVPFRLGGPDFQIDEKRNRIWVGTRHFFLNEDNTLDEATILAKMENDAVVPLIRLPSSYDCGYPGMVLEEDGSVTVIYYSSPSPSTSKIYICRICSTGFSPISST